MFGGSNVEHNVMKRGKHVGLTRPFMQADITVETDEREEVIIIDDDSDTTCNEKELLVQFLLEFNSWFVDEIYKKYLQGEKVNIKRLRKFLRERGGRTRDLSSYAVLMFEYLNLTKEDQRHFPKPRSDCACRFKNIVLKDSTPADFIANTFMFKNDNTSVYRNDISMKEILQLYRFLALDESLSQA